MIKININNINNINARLKHLRKDVLKMGQVNFGQRINLNSNSIVSQLENGQRNITERTILDICREFGINEEWLRNGIGEIFQEKPTERLEQIAEEYRLEDDEKVILENFLNFSKEERQVFLKLTKKLFVEKPQINNDFNTKTINKNTNFNNEFSLEIMPQIPKEQPKEYVNLGFYDIKASAGFGNYLDQNTPKELKLFRLNNKTAKADHAIIVNGNSMEPLLVNDEVIFIKEQPAVENNEIGIFVYDGEIYVKRLILDNGQVILRSQNKNYKDILVNEALEFLTVGKVLL